MLPSGLSGGGEAPYRIRAEGMSPKEFFSVGHLIGQGIPPDMATRISNAVMQVCRDTATGGLRYKTLREMLGDRAEKASTRSLEKIFQAIPNLGRHSVGHIMGVLARFGIQEIPAIADALDRARSAEREFEEAVKATGDERIKRAWKEWKQARESLNPPGEEK